MPLMIILINEQAWLLKFLLKKIPILFPLVFKAKNIRKIAIVWEAICKQEVWLLFCHSLSIPQIV